MQVAELGDDLFAGAEGEVIGVGQDHLGAGAAQAVGVDALDGALSAHGHKRGQVDLSVGRVERRAAGTPHLAST